MSSRDEIIEAVRGTLGSNRANAATVRRDADALLEELTAIRPDLLADDLVEAFIARLVTPKVAATAERIADASELPAAVARYLEARGLPTAIALQPAAVLQALDWSGFELHDRVAPDETLAVGFARWGIAETGSLVFHSDAETPILANFLPLHHLVMVRASTVLAYLDDYAAATAGQRPPRNVNIITGASGTTDIEGSLVLGAHGPRYLHVVILDESAEPRALQS
ncbi:MAG: LUD domain-containing protein [Proteobacteria bacterium]|nr:LUD domain-containing protein [Pseudomonadota bacterium]